MKTIQATVNKRLLTKAHRLFTGTLNGRIIEILQNARRAGATRVNITNQDGLVTVRDNGRGVQDFAVLLDLGGSSWTSTGGNNLEASEDPAGVGLFCLSPREVTVRSRGYVVKIGSEGWTGEAVELRNDPNSLPALRPGFALGKGTQLQFQDEPWNIDAVKSLAVFTGMDVAVDGELCPNEPFIRGKSSHHPELGCRIKVVSESQLNGWHQSAAYSGGFRHNTLVNFHGQVVGFDAKLPHFRGLAFRGLAFRGLAFLVDLTGDPTGIRLMLPARTQMVENESFQVLKAAIEREAFLYLQEKGSHQLPYKEWVRAKELGIELLEAEPEFRVGLLSSDMLPEPAEVVMPKDHSLSQCYRLGDGPDGDVADEANAHLLAALGNFRGFVPVQIHADYDGYSWAKLPTIDKVEVQAGKMLLEDSVWSGRLTAVESLAITVHTSDGKTYRSNVCMALPPPPESSPPPPEAAKVDYLSYEERVLVTREAQQLNAGQIWYHLGGYSDDSDTYDTQEYEFNRQLEKFWMKLVGPDEPTRAKVMEALTALPGAGDWRSVTVLANGCLTIHYKKGADKTILPPGRLRDPTK